MVLDGETDLEVPKEDRDDLFQSQPNILAPLIPTPTQTAALGVTVEDTSPPADDLCLRLLEQARDRTAARAAGPGTSLPPSR